MRNIVDVVDQILLVIPKEEHSFRAELKSLRSSALYAAPESTKMWWSEFQRIINDYLPHPNKCEDWQLHVGSIFIDKPAILEIKRV